jgi:CheY-like chemotaxis protein/two-component sensor histidine kinase
MLEEDAEDEGNEQLIPDLQRIVGSAKHLLNLINDILDLSKIEAGRQELFIEPFDVSELLRGIQETVTPLMAKGKNRFDINCDDNIGDMVGDEQRVRQILFNLLSNAAKFTEQGQVDLSVNLTQRQGQQYVRFQVSDTGIGMSQQQLEKIFDPFIQADGTTTRKYGGTGLGLSIVSQFVELMQGDIDASSTPGQGSRFSVCLPLIYQSATYTSDESGDYDGKSLTDLLDSQISGQNGPGLILLVEDTAESMELMKRTLERRGYQVACAVAGDEGLEMARALKPDVMVLDIMLPGISGWTVLKQLKEEPETANIPVVLCSSLDETRRGYVLGASAYLKKPLERKDFIQTIERLSPHRSIADIDVLVVEDDPDARDILTSFLNKHAKSVTTADNGRTGLEALNQCKPGLILLDLMMPEVDGFQFLDHLRSDPSCTDIPVIAITAKSLSRDERELLDTQVHQVLHKAQYSRDELLHSMMEAVNEPTSSGAGEKP